MNKPIQDIASLPARSKAPAQPTEMPSEPEIVSDIPVRAPVAQPDVNDEVPKTPKSDSDFILSDNPKEANKPNVTLEATIQKAKPKAKDARPKPMFAIAVAAIAVVCLAVGAYLKFVSGS